MSKARPIQVRAEAALQSAALQRAKNEHTAEKIREKYLKQLEGRLPEIVDPRRRKSKGGAKAAAYYENASTGGRLRTTKTPAPRAPWALLDKSARDTLRRQVQQTERNNIVCRGIINRYVDFTIGDGPVVNPTTDDDAFNAEAKRLFVAWMEGTDPENVGRPNLRGMTTFVDDLRELVRAVRLVDGDQLVVRTFDDAGLGTLQYIEAERLVNKGAAWADLETMCGGVEMDSVGRPIAYHVAGWSREGTTLKAGTYAIPARHATLMANPVGFKANQVRGEPQLQAALDWLDVLNGYIESTALASEIATWIGVIFKSERPNDLREIMAGAMPDQPDRETTDEPEEVSFGPAFSHYCKPNESVEQVKPEFPTTNFKDFVHAVVQLIGADVGLPLVLLLYETQAMSWSNLRGTLAIAGRGFDYTQDWARRFVSQVYRWKVSEFITRGLLKRVEGWERHTVRLPLPPTVDFEKEVGGYAAAVDRNFMDEQTACDLLGMGEYSEIVRKRGENRKLAEEAGVLPPTMPGAGVAPAQPADPQEPDDDDPEDEPKNDPKNPGERA